MSATTAVLSDDVLLQRMKSDDHPGPPVDETTTPPATAHTSSDLPRVVAVPTMTTDDTFSVDESTPHPSSGVCASQGRDIVCDPSADSMVNPMMSDQAPRESHLSGEPPRLEEGTRIQQQLFDLLQQQQQTPLLHHHHHHASGPACSSNKLANVVVAPVSLVKEQSPQQPSPRQQPLLSETDLKADPAGPSGTPVLNDPSSSSSLGPQDQTALPGQPPLQQHPLHPLHQLSPPSVLHAVAAPTQTAGIVLPGHHHPTQLQPQQPSSQQQAGGSQPPPSSAAVHTDGNAGSVSEFELARRLGVRFDSSNAAWVARWVDPQNDRKKSRWFSVAKYGASAARRLAIQACLHNMKPSDFLSLRDLQDVLKTFSATAPAPGGHAAGGFAHLPESGVVSTGLGGGLAGMQGLMRGSPAMMDPHHTMQAMSAFGSGLTTGGKLGAPGSPQYAHPHLLHHHAAAAAAAAANHPFGLPGFANPAMAGYMAAAAAAAAAMPPGMHLPGHPAAAAAALASVFCPQFAAAHHAQQASPHHAAAAHQQAFLHHHALQNSGVMSTQGLVPSDALPSGEDDPRRSSLEAPTPKPSNGEDSQHPLIQDASWPCGMIGTTPGATGGAGETCGPSSVDGRDTSLMSPKPSACLSEGGPCVMVGAQTKTEETPSALEGSSEGHVDRGLDGSKEEHFRRSSTSEHPTQGTHGVGLGHGTAEDQSSTTAAGGLMGTTGPNAPHFLQSLAVPNGGAEGHVDGRDSASSTSSSRFLLSGEDGSSSDSCSDASGSRSGASDDEDEEDDPHGKTDGTKTAQRHKRKRRRKAAASRAAQLPMQPSSAEPCDESAGLPTSAVEGTGIAGNISSAGGPTDLLPGSHQQPQPLASSNNALPFGFFGGGNNGGLHNAAMAAAAAAGHLHPSYYSLYPTTFHHGGAAGTGAGAGGTANAAHSQHQQHQLLLHHHHQQQQQQQQQQAHALSLSSGGGGNSGSSGTAGSAGNAAAAAAAAAALHHSMPFLSQQFGLSMLHPHHSHQAATHLQHSHHPSHLHHPHHAAAAAAAAAGFLPQLQPHHLELSSGGATGEDSAPSSSSANAFGGGGPSGGLLGSNAAGGNPLFAYSNKRHSGVGTGAGGGLAGTSGLHSHHHHMGSPSAGPTLMMPAGSGGTSAAVSSNGGTGGGVGSAKMTCERGLHYTKCYEGSQECWIAVWNTKGGRIMHEAFDVSVLGFEGAKNKAREARDAAHSNNVAVSENSRPSWKSHSNTGIPHVSLDSQQLRFRAHKYGRRLCRSFSFGRRRGSYASRESAFDAAVLWLIQTPTDEEIASVSGLSAKIEEAM